MIGDGVNIQLGLKDDLECNNQKRGSKYKQATKIGIPEVGTVVQWVKPLIGPLPPLL